MEKLAIISLEKVLGKTRVKDLLPLMNSQEKLEFH